MICTLGQTTEAFPRHLYKHLMEKSGILSVVVAHDKRLYSGCVKDYKKRFGFVSYDYQRISAFFEKFYLFQKNVP